MGAAHLQIQFHCKYPQALPPNERAKWPTFTPPATAQRRRYCGRVLLRRSQSTLNKWITAHRDTDVVSKEDLDLAKENDRLRRENRILKEEREILKKATQFFAGLKP